MKRVNKYLYLYIVQGYYDPLHGWEDLTAEDTYTGAKHRLAEYRANEPGYPHRLIQRRESNSEYMEA